MNRKGFTLIELLIVVAIIGILAAVVFVALNPLKRFRDSRDSARWQDVTALVDAIVLDQVDNGGEYLTEIENKSDDVPYMIVDGSMDTGCSDNNSVCDVNVNSSGSCVDLSGLVDEGYLADVPVSPAGGSVIWDSGADDGDEGTGYVLTKTSSTIIIQACESENATEIRALR